MSLRVQRGVSLVELMIALVLGLVLSGVVIQVYVANKQAYRLSDAASRIQENARFAMDALTEDIRMAGYQGCGGKTRSSVNTLNSATSFLYDFDVPLVGFEATGASTWNPTLDGSISSPVGGSDIITSRRMLNAGSVTITGQPNNSADCSTASSHTADLRVSSTTGLTAGDIMIASSCSNAAVFQITNISGNGVIHNTGTSSPGNSTKDLGACFAGTGELAKITTGTFYIQNNSVTGIPGLYRKDGSAAADELVEGVENMQILYGEDTDVAFDGSANKYVRANEVTDWSRVVSVRISLLLRSAEDNVVTESQAYTFNGASQTATDRRLRRVYTTTVGLRNRLP